MRVILVIVVGAFLLTACNTVAGMGRDLQGAGTAVEKGCQEGQARRHGVIAAADRRN